MSKRSERLLTILGQVEDKKIDETADYTPKSSWKRWTALAAALALVIGVGGTALFSRMGGNAGAAGHQEGSIFMSYAGPVLPMTLREDNGAVAAQREITLDFQPWVPVWESVEDMLNDPDRAPLTQAEREKLQADLNESYPQGGTYRWSDDIKVEDSYTLTNGGNTDQTVSVLYPFVSELRYLHENRPTLTVDGEPVETAVHVGAYPGGFAPAVGDTEHPEDTVNLKELNSWEGYRDLMEHGAYRANALAPVPNLDQMEVTVYEITLPSVQPEGHDSNPTTRVTFRYDPEKTTILNGGFHGFSSNENGSYTLLAGRDSYQNQGKSKTCYLICLGEELIDLTLDDREQSGWDADTPKLDCHPGHVEQYTLGLGQAIDQVMKQPYQPKAPKGYEELFQRAVWEWAYRCILQDQIQRYNYGNLDDVCSDVLHTKRVFWLEREITIPAGSSVTAAVSMEKEPSFDFHCAGGKNRNVKGYDMVTTLDSNLNFTEQTATLKDRGQIEIVRQNFGFDLENGVSCVELETEKPHYYLEVRRQEGTIPES